MGRDKWHDQKTSKTAYGLGARERRAEWAGVLVRISGRQKTGLSGQKLRA